MRMSRLFASIVLAGLLLGGTLLFGDAVSEILSGRLLQQTRGLPAANLLCQAVATGIPEDWGRPSRIDWRSCRAMREKLSNLASLLLAIPW